MKEDNLFDLSKDMLEVINKYELTNNDFAIMYVKGSMSIIDLESEGIKEAMSKKGNEVVEENLEDDITESKSLQEN